MHSSVQALLAESAFWRLTPLHIIVLLLVIFQAALLAFRRFRYVRSVAWIPGPAALPIVGNALSLTGGQDEFYRILMRCGAEYGPIFRLWVGMRPFVFMAKAADIQPILSSSLHIDKSFEYSFLSDWLGQGLIVSTGSYWQRRRKMLTPAFHYAILEDLGVPIMKQTTILAQVLEKYSNGEVFDICPILKLCALDIICSTAMGKEVHAQSSDDGGYPSAVEKISEVVQRRFVTPWLKPDYMFKRSSLGRTQSKALKVTNEFVDQVIEQRRKEDKTNTLGDRKPAFLDLLLKVADEEGELSTKDIKDEVNTFMFAGHDTTATAVSWCMYAFGKHPEVQARIVEEYEGTIGDSIPSSKDIAKLQYLDCCVKEALRLYPVAPLVARDIRHPVNLNNGEVIPADTTILIFAPLLHRDPTYFPDPEKFNPDRFAPGAGEGRHPFAYIPFSAGPRNCIGQKFAMMTTKLMIISILRKFEVTSVDPVEKLGLSTDLVLNNKGGIKITLKPR